MIHWEIKTVPQGYKVRLVQKDETGLIIQFLQSGGTYKTREQALTAFKDIIADLRNMLTNKEGFSYIPLFATG